MMYAPISLPKTKVRFTKTKREMMFCAADSIDDAALLNPSKTPEVQSDDIWATYATFCVEKYGPDRVPRRRDFQKSLARLVEMGYLAAVVTPYGLWYRMPKTEITKK